MDTPKRWMERGKNIKKALEIDTIEDPISCTQQTLSDGMWTRQIGRLEYQEIMHISNILPITRVRQVLKRGHIKQKRVY